jgi:hypothetical protein
MPVSADTFQLAPHPSAAPPATCSGGYPIVAGSHDHGLIVNMFRNGDPSGVNAVSGRGMLGPKWTEAVKENEATTC